MKNVTHSMMILAVSATLALAADPQPQNAPRLRPGDKVILNLGKAGQAPTQVELKVSHLGQVDLPVTTSFADCLSLPAAGRTVEELNTAAQALAAQYAPDTQLQFAASAPNPAKARGTVTFCGEAQGVVYLERQINTHLAQAVYFLGPSRFANLQKVRVSRTLANGATEQFTVDVERIMAEGYQNDIPLQDGDIVSVPASSWPGRRPITDRPALPVDQLKLFCALSHGKPLPVAAKSGMAPTAQQPEVTRVSQLAAR
jgi:protein involved in polysaccharide export with SLBB domain